ncbi:hypothetical protein V8E53_004917 [Lactarius tabidus]
MRQLQTQIDSDPICLVPSLPPHPLFSPLAYAVWVNSLWFLSFTINITCALLSTLLRQWARRYLNVTQTRYSLHKRARVRSFFAEGVENSLLPLEGETLPTLLHLSLFMFFTGLAVFLHHVNFIIFKVDAAIGRHLHCYLRMYHRGSKFSSRQPILYPTYTVGAVCCCWDATCASPHLFRSRVCFCYSDLLLLRCCCAVAPGFTS